MNRIRTIIVAVVFTLVGLFIPSKTARGDVFGVADSSQLLALIFQTMQDYDMDSGGLLSAFSGEGTNTFSAIKSLFKDLQEKQSDVDRILNFAMKGKKALTTINSVSRTSRQIMRTISELTDYAQFIYEFGSYTQAYEAGYVLRSFQNRSVSLLNEVTRTITEIEQLRNSDATSVLSSMNETLKEFNEQVSNFSVDSITGMIQLINGIIASENIDANRNFSNKVFI